MKGKNEKRKYMETTWRPQTSLLTTKRDSFTVDTVAWAMPSPTRSSEMATPTTSKTNLSLTSPRERARRTSRINRISRQISRRALLQGFLNFLGYLHFFLASYQLEEEVLERGAIQQGPRVPKDDAKTIRSFIAFLTGKINKLLLCCQ